MVKVVRVKNYLCNPSRMTAMEGSPCHRSSIAVSIAIILLSRPRRLDGVLDCALGYLERTVHLWLAFSKFKIQRPLFAPLLYSKLLLARNHVGAPWWRGET